MLLRDHIVCVLLSLTPEQLAGLELGLQTNGIRAERGNGGIPQLAEALNEQLRQLITVTGLPDEFTRDIVLRWIVSFIEPGGER